MASEAERDKRVEQAGNWWSEHVAEFTDIDSPSEKVWRFDEALAVYRAFGEAEAYRNGIKAAKSLVYLDYERHTKDRIVAELERLAREAEERQ